MFTPQQIQEITFEKVMFGGYDMGSVDEFLEPLTEDYIQLYKENSVLKSKMRLLVEKLEEYRAREASMNNAMVAAQQTCDEMVAAAEEKCRRMVSEAEAEAAAKSVNVDAVCEAENERMERAKAEAASFIASVENEVRRHLDTLAVLKEMDLSSVTTSTAKPIRRAYDYESEAAGESDIADEIQQNVDKLVSGEGKANLGDTREMPALRSDRYNDLKFGKNYENGSN